MRRMTRSRRRRIAESKRITKSIITALMLLVFLFPMTGHKASLSANASPGAQTTAAVVESREEVIYANLDATGEVKYINAVNILNISEAGRVEDFGSFALARNLTDTAALTLEDGKVTADVQAGRFYYQGTVDHAGLPWIINISYYLDGVEVAPAKIAGKTGSLVITFETQINDRIDPVFFENYVLQITMTLNAALSSNIEAEGGSMATVANAGQNRRITFTVMPGEADIVKLRADVVTFEMPSMEIAAVPFSMRIEAPDTTEMKDNLKSLSDAIASLNDGVSKLSDGAYDLMSGARKLQEGSQDFNEGLGQLNARSEDLIGASSQINEALGATSAAIAAQTKSAMQAGETFAQLNELASNLSLLSESFTGFHEGLTAYTDGLNALTNSYESLHTGLSGISSGTRKLHEGLKELNQGTKELKVETNDLPGRFEAEINNMLAQFDRSDFIPVSFVSLRNERTILVQFVMRTEAIKMPEITAEPEAEAERSGFWGRFRDLFISIKEIFDGLA